MRNLFVSIQSRGGTEPMRIIDWANRCKQRRHDSFADCERLSSSSSDFISISVKVVWHNGCQRLGI